ncbi:MAG: hypothetical protein NVSMB38_40440 [Ktedonobacteraceae bacterium]
MDSLPLDASCSDDEVVKWVVLHYFFADELAEAQRMMEIGKTYEEAIAYLADRGQDTLRHSDDPQPHLFITIPNGHVSIFHPQRRFPGPPVLRCQVGHLASLALPQPLNDVLPTPTEGSTSNAHYRTVSLFDGVADPSREKDEKPKRANTRPKKVKYIQQPVRVGTAKTWRTHTGWVVKDGHLGYTVIEMKPDFIEVNLMHLASHHVMASIYLSVLDETTHARIQDWVTDVHSLTDWSQGIASLLKEKVGEKKKDAWSRQLEDLWRERHRNAAYQRSLFET